jgi:23S rRNA (guanosine2251-2'-O)-methyltransferase
VVIILNGKVKNPRWTFHFAPSLLSRFMNRKLENHELNRLDVDSFKSSEKCQITVILDDVRSLSNVGSVFRTCDSFQVSQLILCGITGRPPHREIQKTALGATETVDWFHCENIENEIRRLKSEGKIILSVEQSEKSILPDEIGEFDGHLCLVFGNEVNGVSQNVINLSDAVVEIPQSGTKHSLNVAVAAGIVVWEAYKVLKN